MSINSNTLFQAVGKIADNNFVLIGDESNNPTVELSANDITGVLVYNKITDHDISFSDVDDSFIKSINHIENNVIKDNHIKVGYQGSNNSSNTQIIRIVDKTDQLFLGATTTTNKALLY